MQPEDWTALSEQIEQWGQTLGFSAVGITGTDLGRHEQYLEQWLSRGYHGEMDYMARHGSLRSHPAELHPGTHSIISVRLDYLEPSPDPNAVLASDRKAYISRYALGRDYHKVIRQKLKRLVGHITTYLDDRGYPGFNARVFTDSAPLLEKALAEKAGLGWIGKNTLLMNEKAGSWFFLGEVLTNLPLPDSTGQATNRCGSCQACIDVCPTDAIVAPYELDARKCISYLTIELRGAIPEIYRSPMGTRIFGCDDCQLVCPWNRYAQHNAETDFKPRHSLESPEMIELFAWTEDTFLTKTEGSAIRRTGYQGWLRNLAVGLGNCAPTPEIIAALTSRKGLSDLLDEHIDWAVRKLKAGRRGNNEP